jgi:hypothetical protein
VSLVGTQGSPDPKPVTRHGAKSGLRAAVRAVAMAPARVKRHLISLVPVPDPNFDPFKATVQNAPRVREIVLQIGPMPGAVHRRGLEGPSGLAWG